MQNGNTDAAQPLDFGCNNLLGPLPEPDGWIYDGHPDGLQFRRQAITGIEALARSSAPMFSAHQMRAYAAQEVVAERERWRAALSYAISEADGWHDECRSGQINSPEMDAARALLRA